MKQPDVLREIARIEGELSRLMGELGALRLRIEGPPASTRKMTMAFGAVQAPPSSAPSTTPSLPPTPSEAPISSLPTSLPPPPRGRRARSIAPAPLTPRGLGGIEAMSMESVPPPPPSRSRTRSSIVPAAQPTSDAPASSRQESGSGRYGYVSEPRARSARGR